MHIHICDIIRNVYSLSFSLQFIDHFIHIVINQGFWFFKPGKLGTSSFWFSQVLEFNGINYCFYLVLYLSRHAICFVFFSVDDIAIIGDSSEKIATLKSSNLSRALGVLVKYLLGIEVGVSWIAWFKWVLIWYHELDYVCGFDIVWS